MAKMIEAIKWEATNRAIIIMYADSSSDLTNTIRGLLISAGSLAYLGNGDVYVFNGTNWTKIGG